MRALIGASLVVFAAVLYLTRYLNFLYDEWDFVSGDRAWDLKLFFLPHNEHWSTIPILIWKVLFLAFGLRSHIPYEAALLATHIAAVLLLFALIRRRSGDIPAFAAALTLLVLGSGATNIVWAFQIGFVGSVAFGLLAMLLVDGESLFPGRIAAASAALLGSLMCSAVGLAFFAAVGAELLVDPRRRRLLLALVVPTIAFAIWFLEFGAGLSGTPGAPCSTCAPTGFSADIHKGAIGFAYLASLANFVGYGFEAAASGLVGLAEVSIFPIVILAAAVAFHGFRQRSLQSWQVGMAVGALAWFVLIGLGRVQNGAPTAGESRYVYVGAVFLLPLVAGAARELPWRGLWRPAFSIAFAAALVANIVQLSESAVSQTLFMRYEDAELQTAEVFRGAPDMALDRGMDDLILPQLRARQYFAAIDELGSPVPAATPDSLRQLPSHVVDRVMVNLFREGLTVGADGARSTAGMTCQTVDSTVASVMDFSVPQNQWFVLQATKSGEGYLSLGFFDPPVGEPLQHFQLTAATDEWVHLPNTGRPAVWQLRVQTLAVGLLNVCSAAPLQFVAATDAYRADAASFTSGPGWSADPDGAANSGRALKAVVGTPGPQGAYGPPFVAAPVTYDVWFRVRVSSPSGATPQMILTLTDVTANDYVASRSFRPSDATTSYTWLLVASGVTPATGHLLRFQTNIAARLSTDWYIDQAVMLPSGSPPPGP